MAPTDPVVYNTDHWIKENKQYFLPPVCNKMMHNEGQMKVFYVGGPNQRKDYHLEEGEELFFMLKGDMCLKVVEHGKHRDLPIREGEIFLLPGRIPHSPQRVGDTIGLVIERERDMSELDGLRYFVEENGKPTLQSLYEEWFHVEDLGTQLAPVIKRFFASEQFKTGKPVPGVIPEHPPFEIDTKTSLQAPFNLVEWIESNRDTLNQEGKLNLFGDQVHQLQVDVYGKGTHTACVSVAETFIWQLEGSSSVLIDGKNYPLRVNDTLLVRAGQKFTTTGPIGSMSLVCFQDPTRKKS